jgi:hypothetical protein
VIRAILSKGSADKKFASNERLLQPTSTDAAGDELVQPSAGVNPAYGERGYIIEHGENSLYLLKLNRDEAAFLGNSPHNTSGK